ncbi:MAG: hypothetical protein ACJA1R_001027 [Flavobacteriales bacterium]|jgi:hypothetical protein
METSPMSSPCPGLFCLHDGSVPKATMNALALACERFEIDFWPLDAAQLNSWHLAPLPTGSLLYTPAVSAQAERIEARLWGPGVASVFGLSHGPLRQVVSPPAAFALAGVATPRAVLVSDTTPAALAEMADAVGGLPAVLRFPGYSGGRGIVRVDSMPGLISAAQHAAAHGALPELVHYVPNAVCWRVVVIDGAVAGVTRGRLPEGDFRTVESPDADDYMAHAPPAVEEAAIAATRALEVLAAGVDVLEPDDSGALVLEANTPFYFGHLEAHGLRVAEALVSALLRQASMADATA